MAGCDAAVRRDVLWHHGNAHVPRRHRLHIPPGGCRTRQQAKARGCRDQWSLLALCRSGLDVRIPDDLPAVDLAEEIGDVLEDARMTTHAMGDEEHFAG